MEQDLEAELGNALRQMINDFGPSVVDDPRRIRSVMSDLLADDLFRLRPEVDAIVLAATKGVPAALKSAGPTADAASLIQQVVAEGATPERASLAVSLWSSSLGVDLPPTVLPSTPVTALPSTPVADVPSPPSPAAPELTVPPSSLNPPPAAPTGVGPEVTPVPVVAEGELPPGKRSIPALAGILGAVVLAVIALAALAVSTRHHGTNVSATSTGGAGGATTTTADTVPASSSTTAGPPTSVATTAPPTSLPPTTQAAQVPTPAAVTTAKPATTAPPATTAKSTTTAKPATTTPPVTAAPSPPTPATAPTTTSTPGTTTATVSALNKPPVPSHGVSNPDTYPFSSNLRNSSFYVFWMNDSAFSDPEGDRWEYKLLYSDDARFGALTWDQSTRCEDANGRPCIRYTPFGQNATASCYTDTVEFTAYDPTGSKQESAKFYLHIRVNCT